MLSVSKISRPLLVTAMLAGFALFAQSLPESDLQQADEIATEAEKKVTEAEGATSSQPATRDASTPANTGTTTTTTTTPATTTTPPATTTTTTTTQPSSTGSTQAGAIYNDGKNNYATSATKFELVATDNLSTLDFIEYRVDDGMFGRYNQTFNIETEGPHRVIYRSVDKAGNREVDNLFTVIIDNTAPKVTVALSKSPTIIDGRSYLAQGTKLELRASDNYSGVKSLEYSFDGVNFQPYKDGIVLDKAGPIQIKYRAEDNLGNKIDNMGNYPAAMKTEEAQLLSSINVDNTPPAVSIKPTKRLISVDGKTYATRDNTFVVEAVDAGSSVANVMVKIDNQGDWQTYSGPIQFNNEGNHSIEAKAVDKVGNESQPVKIEFITDDNPPKSTLRPVTN